MSFLLHENLRAKEGMGLYSLENFEFLLVLWHPNSLNPLLISTWQGKSLINVHLELAYLFFIKFYGLIDNFGIGSPHIIDVDRTFRPVF